MKAIGIDLGTTNSLAAVGGKDVKVLPTRAGEALTPSVVSFVRKLKSEEGEIVVGRQARSYAARSPEDTVFSIKRLMGAVYGEKRVEEVHKRINYRLADPPPKDAPDQGVRVLLGGRPYSPVDISALILKQVRGDAEQALGETVTHAVITVPAYFEERQRDATRRAGDQAGLNVLRIIDEPTAAALFFGLGKETERHRILVYDFGGGTFDISIIQMVGGQFQVLEIEGDNWLGGDDFDQTIVARMIEWVKETYGFDPSGDKKFLGKAKEEAEKAKIALTVQQSVDIFAPLIAKSPAGEQVDIEIGISRTDFEDAIRPMVDKTIELVQRSLRQQNLTTNDITAVLMVGGSTAIPIVQDAVAGLFGREKVKRHVNPMECVALGAAILADSFELKEDGVSADRHGPAVMEVTAMGLGVAVVKGHNTDKFVPIIPKGTPYPLPEPMRRIFTPTEENQKLIRVPVYEGQNELASLNTQQGIIEFPLPHGIASSTSIEVSFNYDRNRVLTVKVRVLGTDLAIEQTLERDRGRVVRPEDSENLMEDWREELQPALRAGKQFLGTYGDYMEETDRTDLKEAMAQGDRALESGNQVEGKRATLLLHNKILGSGTASQLFIAERAMQAASPEITQQLAQSVAQLRAAFARGDQAKIETLTGRLRLTVAQIMAKKSAVQDVQDRQDFKGLLRETGA